MSTFTDLVDRMEAQFNRMKAELLELLGRTAEDAAIADNSLSIGEKTATQLTNEAKADATTHINDKENPHGATAVGIGGVKSSTIDASVVGRIPEGILPIARYGDQTTGALPVTSNALTVNWTAPVPCMMSGYSREAPIYSETLAKNTTYYVYLRWNGNAVNYFITIDDLAETSTRMYIGRIITGESSVTTLALLRVTRIDTYRVSANVIGSAIPATAGNPATPDVKLNGNWF